jgi:hypothetical protein
MARLAGARRAWMRAGLVGVLVLNVASWVDAALMPAADDEQRGERLLAWLEEHDLHACYSASPLYHVVFLGGESVVISPLQKNRYPAYDRTIEDSESICYVSREDQQDKRQHLAMMALLESKGVRYRTDQVGPYRVLHQLEPRRAIRAEDVEAIRRAPAPQQSPEETATPEGAQKRNATEQRIG